MQDEKQFEQLMLQYTQLKNGASDIKKLIESEDYDSAMTLINNRESLFLNCKCMRKYLELTPEQEDALNNILDELRTMEMENINLLSRGMEGVQRELKVAQQTEKFQQAYEFNENQKGSIINYTSE